MPRHATDLSKVGKFNFLQPLYKTGKKVFGSIEWMCRCDCGNLKAIPANQITRHSSKSCGKCGLAPRGGNMKERAERKKVAEAEPTLLTLLSENIKTKGSALAKALTGIYRKRRKLTANEIGILEARACGAGRWNF